jgi:hypothetical protein
MKRALPVLFTVPFAVGLLVASLAWSSVVYLPLVTRDAVAQEFPPRLPPAPLVDPRSVAPDVIVDTLPGIVLHLTGPDMELDANGTRFAKTRAPSEIGDIVWLQYPNGAIHKVLEPGPKLGRGNGRLKINRDGYLYLITADDQNRTLRFRVPGWQPW